MKKKKRRKRRWTDLLLVLILLIGLGIVAYPSFSDYWNSFHQSRAIVSYAESVATLDNAEYERMWDEAMQYNGYLVARRRASSRRRSGILKAHHFRLAALISMRRIFRRLPSVPTASSAATAAFRLQSSSAIWTKWR